MYRDQFGEFVCGYWGLKGHTGLIQKIATIFQGIFKDHIRFSRTTY